jgi:hypothetical protein
VIRLVRDLTLLLMFLYMTGTHAQSDVAKIGLHVQERGQFQVGFRLLETQDHSRSVNGGLSSTTPFPRPIRVYLWYPASRSDESQAMQFGRYAQLADEDIWPVEIAGGLREQLKFSQRALARSLGKDRLITLLQQPVAAIEAAKPLKGPFPLIVIAQGVYYESPVVFSALAEYLAGRGFVVATCPLVGTNSPIVTVDVSGLETQVRDLEFVIARARQFSYVSQDKLGVFGFDMGGMAGLILTMRNVDVDAFVSVSSDVLYPHPAGIPLASPDYNPAALRSPWLHSVPSSWIRKDESSSKQSLFDTARYSDRYLLLTENMGHVDYTGYALIEGRPAMAEYWEAAKPGDVDRYVEVSHYIANFYAAYLKEDSDGLAFLLKKAAIPAPGSKKPLEHRPATQVSITYAEFVQAVIAGRANDAITRLRQVREKQPDHILLQETYLNRLVYSLRATWGLDREILPVLKFNAELYPESVNALYMLAEGEIKLGQHSAAIKTYNRLLELDPDDKENYIKPRLEWLHGQ